MTSLNIAVTDHATKAAAKLLSSLQGADLQKVIAATAARTTRRHLIALDAERHRPHVQHHFYAAAAKATTWSVASAAAEVIIDKQGIAQRYYGGEIRPRRSPFLTIPVRPEADGRRAREIPDLVAIWNRSTRKGVLKKKGKGGLVYFALTDVVDQDADKTVIPDATDFDRDIRQAITDYMERQTQ